VLRRKWAGKGQVRHRSQVRTGTLAQKGRIGHQERRVQYEGTPVFLSFTHLFRPFSLQKMSPAPQEHQRPPSTSPDPPTDPDVASMAAVAVGTIPASTNGGQVNKRYRPAPAKTFQCRGYGECRMVFSRSEHLARHIRFVSLS